MFYRKSGNELKVDSRFCTEEGTKVIDSIKTESVKEKNIPIKEEKIILNKITKTR